MSWSGARRLPLAEMSGRHRRKDAVCVCVCVCDVYIYIHTYIHIHIYRVEHAINGYFAALRHDNARRGVERTQHGHGCLVLCV